MVLSSYALITFRIWMSQPSSQASNDVASSQERSQSTVFSLQHAPQEDVEEVLEEKQEVSGLNEGHASVFALAFKQGTKTMSGQRQHYAMALREYCGKMADAMQAEGERRGLTKIKNIYLIKTWKKLYKPNLKDAKTTSGLKDMLLKPYKAYKEGQFLVLRAASYFGSTYRSISSKTRSVEAISTPSYQWYLRTPPRACKGRATFHRCIRILMPLTLGVAGRKTVYKRSSPACFLSCGDIGWTRRKKHNECHFGCPIGSLNCHVRRGSNVLEGTGVILFGCDTKWETPLSFDGMRLRFLPIP